MLAVQPSSSELWAPTIDGRWDIVKQIYRHHQQDGSVLQTVAFRCPAKLCTEEFEELSGLVDHIYDVHKVCLDPCGPSKKGAAKKTIANDGFYIRTAMLSSGETRLVCPQCVMQFPLSAKAQLMEHVSRVHGHCCATSPEDALKQPSERMDLLWQAPSAQWFPQRESVLSRMRVVSLGSFCGMKLSMQQIGLGEAHLPFDWIRSSQAGVAHFVKTGFQDFFSVASQCDVEEANLRMFRSARHSFWHDDILDGQVRDKLQRRIERFLALREDPKDLLFLRSLASTDELQNVEDLYEALRERFGTNSRRILLAVVVDGQEMSQGPILHAQQPGIIFYQRTPLTKQEVRGPVYSQEVAAAASLALAAPVGSMGFGIRAAAAQQLGAVAAVPSGAAWLAGDGPPLESWRVGLHSGFGNLQCFEDHNSCNVHVDLRS